MSSNNPIDTSILPAFIPAVPAQASLMLNPKYQVMEVQSRTRSYESPKILATHFIIEQGFAQSPASNDGLKHITGDDVQDESNKWE